MNAPHAKLSSGLNDDAEQDAITGFSSWASPSSSSPLRVRYGWGEANCRVTNYAATVLGGTAGQRDQIEAGRSRSHKALENGRLDQAFEFYRNLDERDLEAEDFFRLGSVLLDQKKIVLGWAALAAARRIDPTHLATIRALNALTDQTGPGPGSRSIDVQRGSRASRAFAFRAGWTTSGHVDTRPGSVLRRSRPGTGIPRPARGSRPRRLRGLNSRAAVFKLIARLLLEMGRADDARALLQQVVDTRGPAPAPDREAAWLLTRAALQLDDKEAADSMLALAGDFGKTATSSPEPSPFVGSRRCRDCHLRIYGEEQVAGAHAHTLRFGPDLKSVPLPAQPVADPVFPRVTHHFSRKGDERIEVETRIDDRTSTRLLNMRWDRGTTGSPWSPATTPASIVSCGYLTSPRHRPGSKPRESTWHRKTRGTTSASRFHTRRSIGVSIATRLRFGRSTSTAMAGTGPRHAIVASAANDAMGRD